MNSVNVINIFVIVNIHRLRKFRFFTQNQKKQEEEGKDMPRRRKRSKSRGVIRRRRSRFDSEDERISLDSPACLIPKSLKEVSAVSYYDGEGTTLSEIARTHSQSNTYTDEKGHHRCKLDIYGEQHNRKEKSPVLIYVHGGSWRVGHRRA